MAISGTLGAMLHGVSQQPAYLRSDGQVTAQVNMISDVTRGLTTRPAARFLSEAVDEAGLNNWTNVSLKGDIIQIAHKDGYIVARKLDGTNIPIAIAGAEEDYIGDDMRAYVYDERIYLLNRDKLVLVSTDTPLPTGPGHKSATIDGDLYHIGSAYATSVGGKYGQTYTVTATYSDGTQAEGTYTTPDGSDPAHTSEITSDKIIEELSISLAAHANWKGTSTVEQSKSVMRIWDTTFDVSLSGDDGDGGVTLRTAGIKTKNIEDIPATAAHGQVLRVVGENAAEDDLWFRYEGQWDEKGTWVETYNPQEPVGFDLSTMPHVLSGDASGLTLAEGDWQQRRTGDAVTNPMPSFVGEALRDITGFQSRIVVIGDKSVVMSRTNIPTDFFRSSASQRLVTDSIDMISTTESDYTLEWVQPFDRDLVVWGLRSQFLIKGELALSPSNASIVQTTNFETDGSVRPVSTGRTLLFPFREGGFTGIKEFYSANSVDANEAISITKVQSRYLPGHLTQMISSTNFSLVVMTCDGDENSLYVHQYYFDGEKKVQSAWYRLALPYKIVNVTFDGSSLYVIGNEGTTYSHYVLDFSLPDSHGVPYHVCLDASVEITGGVQNAEYTEFTSRHLDPTGQVYVQGEGCAVPGNSATPTFIGPNTVRFDSNTVPDGAAVWEGVRYDRYVKPTMPVVRDKEDKPIANAKLVLGSIAVYYEDSGSMTIEQECPYRANNITQTNLAVSVANDPLDPDQNGISSGVYRAKWGERTDRSEIKVGTDDTRPLTITEIEWEGQVLSRGTRL